MNRSIAPNAAARLLARFAQGVLVVFIAASVGFLLIKSLPGDMLSDLQFNPNIDAERIAQLSSRFGVNVPISTKYWNWLSGMLHGDFLDSSSQHEPVMRAIGHFVPNTLRLMLFAFCSSLLGGIILGTWQGSRLGTRGERISSGITLVTFSLPDFWVAMLLQFVFVVTLGLFPSQGMHGYQQGMTFAERLLDNTRHAFLPWLSLTLVDVAVFARYQRAAIREVANQQFLRTARAKGVSETLVTWKHALRVSLLPLITISGLYFPALLVGAILIEKIFAWPGVGLLLTTAVASRDYLLVTGIVFVGSAMTAVGSFLADVVREFADPRLRT